MLKCKTGKGGRIAKATNRQLFADFVKRKQLCEDCYFSNNTIKL